MQEATVSRNMMLCFEEIAVQNIIRKSGKDTSIYPVCIEAEYSEQDGSVTMNFTWGGAPIDRQSYVMMHGRPCSSS